MTIGAVCLGRDHSAPETIITSSTGNADQVGTTQTTSADNNEQSAGTAAPASSTNITSTTIIVNPATASTTDNSGGTQPQPQPIIIQQAAPASAPPADTSNQQQTTAPASTMSPESVEAQDQRDQQRQMADDQIAQGQTQIIPVPIPEGRGSRDGRGGASENVNPTTIPAPGATNPTSNYYPPGPTSPGQIGPNVPNGGAGTLNPSGGRAPVIPPFGAVRR